MWLVLVWIISPMHLRRMHPSSSLQVWNATHCHRTPTRLFRFFLWILCFGLVHICSMKNSELANPSIQLHLHQPIYVVLHVTCCVELHHVKKKSYLHSSLVSNISSTTGCIWHYLSYLNFSKFFLDLYFLCTPKTLNCYP